jgi:Flp pilus assembly protein TadB
MNLGNVNMEKISQIADWFGLNLAWGVLSWALFTNTITWGLAVIGAVTLIWFNIERALKARQDRHQSKKHFEMDLRLHKKKQKAEEDEE